MHLIIPKDYNPVLNTRDTEIAIKLVKDFFERELARQMQVSRAVVNGGLAELAAQGFVEIRPRQGAPWTLTFWRPANGRKSSIPWPSGSVWP